MSKFNQSSEELFDKVIYLEEDDSREPMRVLRRFFSDYRLHECRDILRTMVNTCITTDNAEFSEPEDRADLLTRHQHLEELLEAGWLLVVTEKKQQT